MAVAALLAFLSPSYWLYYAAIVGSVVAVSKARIKKKYVLRSPSCTTHVTSPVTGSSILLYSSRVCPNSEILLLSPLEDENHAKPTLFPQFSSKEGINF